MELDRFAEETFYDTVPPRGISVDPTKEWLVAEGPAIDFCHGNGVLCVADRVLSEFYGVLSLFFLPHYGCVVVSLCH